MTALTESKYPCKVLAAVRSRGSRAMPVATTVQQQSGVRLIDTMMLAACSHQTMVFHEPECPFPNGSKLPELRRIRPPYDLMWVETLLPHDRPVGYMITGEAAEDRSDARIAYTMTIMGFWIVDLGPGPVAAMRFKLDKLGDCIGTSVSPLWADRGDKKNEQLQTTMMAPCAVVLNRLNYRNIGYQVHRDPDDRQDLPRAIRRHAAGMRYHTCVIRSDDDIKQKRRVVEHAGIMPLSWTRGHTAKYGIDGRGPLFGKYVCEVWKPAHRTGDAKNGTIQKDYRLASRDRPTPDVMSVAAAFQRNEQPEEARQ